jgi:death-on-curing protein
VARRRKPRWPNRVVVDAIHADQIREHGGLPGIRDETVLESALARPLQKWQYQDDVDVPLLAAAYAFGLVTGHPYRDGNKRIGFLAMATFLGINGHGLDATDAEVVTLFLQIANGSVSEDEIAEWVRKRIVTPR